MTQKELEEADKVSFVVKFREDSDKATIVDRRRFRTNFKQFSQGTTWEDKEDWMSQVSLGKYETRIRAAVGRVRNRLIYSPTWYDLEPTNPQNQRALELKEPLKKLHLYYLRRGEFHKRVGTILLSAFIGLGSCFVGWTRKLVQNPKALSRANDEQFEKEQRELAKKVANPLNTSVNGIDFEASIQSAFDKLSADTSSNTLPSKKKEDKFLQIGTLDIRPINPENRWWDHNVSYLHSSKQGCHVEYEHLHTLRHWADVGFIDSKVLDDLSDAHTDFRNREQGLFFDNQQPLSDSKLVELTYYFGPLILDGKIKEEAWGCIIANKSTIIKEWKQYPYWEPIGHNHHPYVDTWVKEIPFRATGAGVGDNAVAVDRAIDSDINLARDQMRFNLVGFSVINYNTLLEPDAVEAGIEPGRPVFTRGDVNKVYKHINLTNNIEQTFSPVSNLLHSAIDEQMGITSTDIGGPTKHSRTSATVAQLQAEGSESNVNDIAIDIEQSFLIPFLEKTFARVLQFGLAELNSNPELKELLTEQEFKLLNSIGSEERLSVVNHFYSFKLEGFRKEADRADRRSRLSEGLSILQAGGPMAAVINPVPLAKAWLKELELDDFMQEAVVPETETERIIVENQLLQAGTQIKPGEQDNDEAHIEGHSQVVNPTPQMQQHVQFHQQRLMAKQQAEQQSQALMQQQGTALPQ